MPVIVETVFPGAVSQASAMATLTPDQIQAIVETAVRAALATQSETRNVGSRGGGHIDERYFR